MGRSHSSKQLIKRTISTPTTTEDERDFHLFPDLPPELQLQIWEHAASAQQLIELKFAGVKENFDSSRYDANWGLRRFVGREFMPIGLELACWESRKAMDRIRGKGYFFSDAKLYQHKEDQWSHLWFRFSPNLDTLHFSGWRELSIFHWLCGLSIEKIPFSRGSALAVRSVAVSGCLRYARFGMQDNAVLMAASISRRGRLTPIDASLLFRALGGLEELIMVHEGIAKLSANAKSARNNQIVVRKDSQDTEERLQTWKSYLEKDLKGWAENEVRDQGVTRSAWWSDPKVTLLTEDELKARFK